jgi:hypothetical protein
VNVGARKTVERSLQAIRGRVPVASGGTRTSSIRWPKKVALARSSMLRNADRD